MFIFGESGALLKSSVRLSTQFECGPKYMCDTDNLLKKIIQSNTVYGF